MRANTNGTSVPGVRDQKALLQGPFLNSRPAPLHQFSYVHWNYASVHSIQYFDIQAEASEVKNAIFCIIASIEWPSVL